MAFDPKLISARKEALHKIAEQLKREFFGLDLIIEKVIDSMYAWFVFPELINRPIIVNLWGMTGVGKTQMVRRIASLSQFGKKFVEIQMDGTSGGSMYRQDSIASILADSTISEGELGILLLDEIQRFRTVDDENHDAKVERFQDVWMLLSDGRFSADMSFFKELEMMIAQHEYDQEREGEEEDSSVVKTLKNLKVKGKKTKTKITKKKKPTKALKFQVYPYEARMLRNALRLQESIQEIMTWSPAKVGATIRNAANARTEWQIDYSKLLIFVSGNLDSVFEGARDVGDCDTDADFYHAITQQISSTNIKQGLLKRFKPEQVSRLGSNHVIFPALSKAAYQDLIKAHCHRYITEMERISGLSISITDDTYGAIYRNAVYPTQGTRPVFSAIHNIFGNGLVRVACWALERDLHTIAISLDEAAREIVGIAWPCNSSVRFPVELEITKRRARMSDAVKYALAIHETGHSVVAAILSKNAPFETKINSVSNDMGYVIGMEEESGVTISNRQSELNGIARCLGGIAAEEVFLGEENRTAGCKSDLAQATENAATFIRRLGFSPDGTLTRIEPITNEHAGIFNTDFEPTNELIERIVQNEFARAKQLIRDHIRLCIKIIDALVVEGSLNQDRYIELAAEFVALGKGTEAVPYDDMYRDFVRHLPARLAESRVLETQTRRGSLRLANEPGT